MFKPLRKVSLQSMLAQQAQHTRMHSQQTERLLMETWASVICKERTYPHYILDLTGSY
jgi:hypothetical protein